MIKFHNLYKNNSGMTLVEVMLAIAISAMVSLGIMRISEMSNKSIANAEAKAQIRYYLNEDLKRVLGDDRSCIASFGTSIFADVVTQDNTVNTINVLTNTNPITTATYVSTGDLVAEGNWQITDMTLRQFIPSEVGSKTGNCPLAVTFEKANKSLTFSSTQRVFTIPIYCRIGNDNASISNCISSQASKEGIWTKEYVDEKVYINYLDTPGGFMTVGDVGGNLPEFPVEVFFRDVPWKLPANRRGIELPESSVYSFRKGHWGITEVGDCLQIMGDESFESMTLPIYGKFCPGITTFKNGFDVLFGDLSITNGYLLVGYDRNTDPAFGPEVSLLKTDTTTMSKNALVVAADSEYLGDHFLAFGNNLSSTKADGTNDDAGTLAFGNNVTNAFHSSTAMGFQVNLQTGEQGAVAMGANINYAGGAIPTGINQIFGTNITYSEGRNFLIGDNLNVNRNSLAIGYNISNTIDGGYGISLGNDIVNNNMNSMILSAGRVGGVGTYSSSGDHRFNAHAAGGFHFLQTRRFDGTLVRSLDISRDGMILHGDTLTLQQAPANQHLLSTIFASKESTNEAGLSSIIASNKSSMTNNASGAIPSPDPGVGLVQANFMMSSTDSRLEAGSDSFIISSGQSNILGTNGGILGVGNGIIGSFNSRISNCAVSCGIIGGVENQLVSTHSDTSDETKHLGSDIIIGGQENSIFRYANYVRTMGLNSLIGGYQNKIESYSSSTPSTDTFQNFIIGGHENYIRGGISNFIFGGYQNEIHNQLFSSILAGRNNAINGGPATAATDVQNNMIMGGNNNTINSGAHHNAIFGQRINVNPSVVGSMALRVHSSQNPASTLVVDEDNRLYMEAEKGIYFYTGDGAADLTYLDDTSGWQPPSSIKVKENLITPDKSDFMSKFSKLEVEKWNYKGESRSYIGPYAEDFYNAYSLGHDDKHISNYNRAGVTLMAAKFIESDSREIRNQLDILGQVKAVINGLLSSIGNIINKISNIIFSQDAKIDSIERSIAIEKSKVKSQRERLCDLNPRHKLCEAQ